MSGDVKRAAWGRHSLFPQRVAPNGGTLVENSPRKQNGQGWLGGFRTGGRNLVAGPNVRVEDSVQAVGTDKGEVRAPGTVWVRILSTL